eukprot:4833908-Pyramimonas_sp.AAC.1
MSQGCSAASVTARRPFMNFLRLDRGVLRSQWGAGTWKYSTCAANGMPSCGNIPRAYPMGCRYVGIFHVCGQWGVDTWEYSTCVHDSGTVRGRGGAALGPLLGVYGLGFRDRTKLLGFQMIGF